MRSLKRNQQPFWYCLFKEKAPVLDSNNQKTGEYLLKYYQPIQLRGSISAERGSSQIELFGDFQDYDRVIIIDNPNCPIQEDSVLFVDKDVTFDSDNVPLYDYIVKRKAKSINSVAYAIRKVR